MKITDVRVERYRWPKESPLPTESMYIRTMSSIY